MAETFIPGYFTEIEIATEDYTLIANVTSFSDDQTAVPKPTFGSKYRRTIAGQGLYTIDVSGHLSAEKTAALWALRANPFPVAWSVAIGDQGQASDGGIVAGTAVVTNLTFEVDAEQNWAWSCTLEGDGEPTYTPAV